MLAVAGTSRASRASTDRAGRDGLRAWLILAEPPGRPRRPPVSATKEMGREVLSGLRRILSTKKVMKPDDRPVYVLWATTWEGCGTCAGRRRDAVCRPCRSARNRRRPRRRARGPG